MSNFNVYDVLYKQPALEAADMPKGLEELAQRLVKSGRLRIDADEKINFVRYPNYHEVIFFSHRELYDPALIPRTLKVISKDDLEVMRREISTNPPVPASLEIKLARMFVQSNHPSVIGIILIEGVEVFLSFSHNIGDLLSLDSWEAHGRNSGMQALGIEESRIYVSSGFDPFDTNPDNQENAKNALSRFMVIAAQETGHFADLRRNNQGIPYSRFSLDGFGYRVNQRVKLARIKDMNRVRKTKEIFFHLKLGDIAKLERSVSFFKKHRRYSFKHISAVIRTFIRTRRLHMQARKFNVRISKHLKPSDIVKMVSDMEFNLSPKADVYKNKNPAVEEAIACVEALARVPQQVIKWGHEIVKFMYPNMYRIYYGEVIHGNVKALAKLKSRVGKVIDLVYKP